MCGSQRQAVLQRFFAGFCAEDEQLGRPESLYLSLRILWSNAFSTQTQNFVRVGCRHGTMLASRMRENRGLERVWEFPRRSWAPPEGFVASQRSLGTLQEVV